MRGFWIVDFGLRISDLESPIFMGRMTGGTSRSLESWARIYAIPLPALGDQLQLTRFRATVRRIHSAIRISQSEIFHATSGDGGKMNSPL